MSKITQTGLGCFEIIYDEAENEEKIDDPLGIGLSKEEILSYKSAYDKGHLDKTDIMADGFTKTEVEQILNYNA